MQYVRSVSRCHFYCYFHDLGVLLNLINFTDSEKQKVWWTKMIHANAASVAKPWKQPEVPQGILSKFVVLGGKTRTLYPLRSE